MTERADPGLRERLERMADYEEARLQVIGEWRDIRDEVTTLRSAAATLARVERLVEQWERDIAEEDNDEWGWERVSVRRDDVDDLRRALRPSAEDAERQKP